MSGDTSQTQFRLHIFNSFNPHNSPVFAHEKAEDIELVNGGPKVSAKADWSLFLILTLCGFSQQT